MAQMEALPPELANELPAWARTKVWKSRLCGIYRKQMFFYNVKFHGNLLGLICYFRDHLPTKIGEEYYQDSSGTIRFRCRRCSRIMEISV